MRYVVSFALAAAALLVMVLPCQAGRRNRGGPSSCSGCQGGSCASGQCGAGFGVGFGYESCACQSGECGLPTCQGQCAICPGSPWASARPLSARALAAVAALPPGTLYRVQWSDGSLSEWRVVGGSCGAVGACQGCQGGFCPTCPGR